MQAADVVGSWKSRTEDPGHQADERVPRGVAPQVVHHGHVRRDDDVAGGDPVLAADGGAADEGDTAENVNNRVDSGRTKQLDHCC